MLKKQNIKTHTVEDLQSATAALVKQVADTKQPIRVQATGQPPVIMLDEESYDWYIHLINFARLMNEAEADIRAGQVRPAKEFFDELRVR